MAGLGSLVIDLRAETAQFKADMQRAGAEIQKFSTGMERHSQMVRRAASAMFAAFSVREIVNIGRSIIETSSQFQKYRASLETVLQSQNAANEAFRNLQEFATKTPFTLDQSIESFIKLKALGLDPSARALTSFGNTASAFGKDMKQFIEAVADAATNEFERLKEFGIKAKQEADTVNFTFRGVKTEVRKSTADIVEYLTRIGETDFAGAMSKQMERLPGKISNLGDAFTNLKNAIGELGLNKVVSDIADVSADAMKGMTGLADDMRRLATETNFAANAVTVMGKNVQNLFPDDVAKSVNDSLFPALDKVKSETDDILKQFQEWQKSAENISKSIQSIRLAPGEIDKVMSSGVGYDPALEAFLKAQKGGGSLGLSKDVLAKIHQSSSFGAINLGAQDIARTQSLMTDNEIQVMGMNLRNMVDGFFAEGKAARAALVDYEKYAAQIKDLASSLANERVLIGLEGVDRLVAIEKQSGESRLREIENLKKNILANDALLGWQREDVLTSSSRAIEEVTRITGERINEIVRKNKEEALKIERDKTEGILQEIIARHEQEMQRYKTFADGIDRSFQTDRQRLQENLRTLNEGLRMGAIDNKQFDRTTKLLHDEFNGWIEASRRTAQTMQESFSDLFFGVMQGNLTGFTTKFIASIDRIVADLASRNLFNWLGGMLGQSGGIGGFLFGGGRASGGSVNPGNVYRVGEAGAEYFIPATAGSIQPAGGNTFNVSMVVNAKDANSFRANQARIMGELTAELAYRQRRGDI
ncbi:MAG: tape measure protein [Candidatus Omnitrophota bacterium]